MIEKPSSRLGIDIGRVIIAGDGADTNFLNAPEEEALKAPSVLDAFEMITILGGVFGRPNVFLISKCGQKIQERTRRWLKGRHFWEKTKVPEDNLRFCRKRHEKAPICKDLGITHFVDDRIDCLDPMKDIVPNRFLFGPQRHAVPSDLVAVKTWEEALNAILRTY